MRKPTQADLHTAAAALRQPGAALLVDGRALWSDLGQVAGRIAAVTGCRLLAPCLPARIRRGAGAVRFERLAYVVEENVLAHRDIRLHAAQADQLQRFGALSHSLRNLSIKSSVASAAMTPMTQMLAALALSAVITMALVQSTGNQNSVGAFAAFVTAMLMLIAPIKHLSEVASPITRGLAAIERGLALIEATLDRLANIGPVAVSVTAWDASLASLLAKVPVAVVLRASPATRPV